MQFDSALQVFRQIIKLEPLISAEDRLGTDEESINDNLLQQTKELYEARYKYFRRVVDELLEYDWSVALAHKFGKPKLIGFQFSWSGRQADQRQSGILT